mgnify:CR=1 FL=1
MIVFRDGSIRKGRVTFVNRGTVDFADEEFSRSTVASIYFAGAAVPVSDYLILTDGASRSGSLTTCSAASCTLDGSLVPLSNIQWIGLAREEGEVAGAGYQGVDFVRKFVGRT